jgi:Fe-S cluster assembly iron-binding protein IscA
VGLVLTITPEASQAIRGILAASEAPDGSMFRIAPQAENGTAPGPGLMLSVIESPPPGDQIVEGEEVSVSVEPTAAALLDDKELDASVIGEQVNFSIADQTA